MSGVLTMGETMAVLTPSSVGPLRHASALGLGVAGAESNVAIGVQRLGVAATWIGRVGADELGHLVARTLRAEGVATHAIVDDDAPTGLMFKEQRTTATTRVAYYRSRSAGSRLSRDDLDEAWFEGVEVLHISGIALAISETARAAVLHAIDLARDAGAAVSLDVNHRSRLWSEEEAREALAAVLPSVTVLLAGDDEAHLLVDDSADVLQALAELGPSEVLLKRGAAGAEALVEGHRLVAPLHAVDAIDPVGAGDAFAAGYLAARCRGGSPAERLAVASASGAFAVTVRGDWEGAPSWDELDLLRSAGGHVQR